jgi:hypothetical protein
MQNFTKRIRIEEGYSPEFSFNRIHTVNGVHYYVSVMDKRGQSYAFNMELKDKSWKIINAPKLPDWIMRIEKELGDAIFEGMIGSV